MSPPFVFGSKPNIWHKGAATYRVSLRFILVIFARWKLGFRLNSSWSFSFLRSFAAISSTFFHQKSEINTCYKVILYSFSSLSANTCEYSSDIVVFGHSFIRNLRSHVVQLGEFNLRLDSRHYRIIMHGVAGLTIEKADNESDVVISLAPEAIVLDLGSNDLDNVSQPDPTPKPNGDKDNKICRKFKKTSCITNHYSGHVFSTFISEKEQF